MCRLKKRITLLVKPAPAHTMADTGNNFLFPHAASQVAEAFIDFKRRRNAFRGLKPRDAERALFRRLEDIADSTGMTLGDWR